MKVFKSIFPPTYSRENGLWVFNTQTLSLPDGFNIIEQNLVSIPPGVIAGQHKHPRIEILIATTPMEFAWIDEKGILQRENMYKPGELSSFFIPAFVPHAVRNTSTSPGILFELANESQHDVITIEVLK